MEFTKEVVATKLNDLEQQEKIVWAELNKILGAKAVFMEIWNKLEEEANAIPENTEKGD